MLETATPVYIGMGSNLENPQQQLLEAAQKLRDIPNTELIALSPVYRTAPLGPPGQPDYINAAAKLMTRLAPEALLDQLQAVEAGQGRVRDIRWGPRTLDLDIILFGNLHINTPRLIVPHIEMRNRNFVVIPLHDIDPGLQLPDGSALDDLATQLGTKDMERLMEADAFMDACS